MPQKLRKVRKMRGSRTHGYGVVGQHRKTGAKGHRKVGRHKGGWTYTVKYEPDYFGKKGFTPRGAEKKTTIINIGELEDLISRTSHRRAHPKRRKGKQVFLNLKELGYDKLLGKGKITQPILVTVDSCSKTAAKKLEEARGQILKETK